MRTANDEEDELSVPAGRTRLFLGLFSLPASLALGVLSDSRFLKGIAVLWLVSIPFIILKRPDREPRHE